MVQFVKPNLLGKYQEYLNRFVNPITNGQYTDSTEYDIQIMRRRAHVLHKMLDGCVQVRVQNNSREFSFFIFELSKISSVVITQY